MPKELFNQSQYDILAESDRLASGIPGQTGAKNITVLKFITQIKDWLAVFYSDLIDRITSYPDFPDTPLGNVLSDDGTFKPMAVAVGGFASNIYFSQTDSDISGYKSQTYTPDVAETVISPTVIVGDGNKLLYSYLYSAAVGVTSIPAGDWSFTFCSYVDSATGITQIGYRSFKYTSLGVKEYLFSSIIWSDEINNTTREYKTTQSIQPAFTVNATDRLGTDVYIKTNSSATRTVNIVIGDGQASFMNVPLPIRHAVLRDKNGESGFLHVTEDAQTFAGVKTFSSIPVLPASDPTTDNQAGRKKYIDTVGKYEIIEWSCSDETTALTTGTSKIIDRIPYNCTIIGAKITVGTAPTGSTIIVDFNLDGSSIFSTRISIDANEKTSTTAATPYVLLTTSATSDQEITIDFDQIGATIAGAGLKFTLYLTRT